MRALPGPAQSDHRRRGEQRLRASDRRRRVEAAEARVRVPDAVVPAAVSLRTAATSVALRPGFAAQTSAAAPATSGEANEVPLS